MIRLNLLPHREAERKRQQEQFNAAVVLAILVGGIIAFLIYGALVAAIDVERERISLGIKHMAGDPFGDYAGQHEKGAMVRGVVKSVDARGAVVDLGNDTEGYLRASEISRDRVEDARSHFNEGDTVEAMIINVDRKNRSIQLSIKAKDNVETADALERISAESGATTGMSNLGALLRAKLDGQREER